MPREYPSGTMILLWLLFTWRLTAVLLRRGHALLAWLAVLGLAIGGVQLLDEPALAIYAILIVYAAWIEAESDRGYHVRPTWVDRMLGI